MTTRPRLVRSVPYWILVVGSIASLGFGAWMVVDKLGTMTVTLTDNSATGVDVYAGQSWIVFGTAFVAAGLVGVFTALALAALRGQLPAQPVPVAEPIDWTAESDAEIADETAPSATDADDSDDVKSDAEPAPAPR